MATKTRPPTRRRTATKKPTIGKLPLVLGGVVVLALVVLLAVFTASGREEAISVADLEGNPVITGDHLPPFEGDPATDPAIGTRAPVITGAGFDGETTILAGSGNPQMLMFLASWCPACQAELPEVVRWLEDGHLPEGVELKAVATGLDSGRPNWPPDAWFEREGYEGSIVVDDADGDVAAAFGLTATPYWVMLDAEGQVVVRISGMIDTPRLTSVANALAQG